MHELKYPWRVEGGELPRAGHGCWEAKSGPLQEQCNLSTLEPSFESSWLIHIIVCRDLHLLACSRQSKDSLPPVPNAPCRDGCRCVGV